MAQVRRGPPATPAAVPAGTGSIEGTASDATSHAPLKKVQVTLSGPAAGPPTAVTDASGRFAFRELAAGNYWVNARKPGYNPPQTILSAQTNVEVVLSDGEQKKGVEIELTPGGTIGGRVVNAEGVPIRGCSVSAAQPDYEQNHRIVREMGGGSTNEKGEYRINQIAAGRYYVFARCRAQLPAAHALLPRGDPRTPHETYLPQFHGGVLDPATATRIAVAAGATQEGVDFRMTRVPAFTLRGSVTASDPEAWATGVNVTLEPVNRLMRNLMNFNSFADPQSRSFQIPAVLPGSYYLVAHMFRQGRVFAAQRTVDIAAAPPDPLEISLSSGAELKGSVQFDGDDHPPLENVQISLALMEGVFPMSRPQAQLDKGGGFTLTGVLPGRWRATVSLQGFVKSVTLAGRTVSPDGFQIAAGAAGPLHIVMGSKLTDVEVEVADAPPDRQVSAVIFPEDASRLGAGLERSGSAMGGGRIGFGGLAPGRYRVFATDIQNPWGILQRPDWLKALGSHSTAIEVPEGGHASATVEILSREELMRALDDGDKE
jgi:hypothetical protein